MRYNFSIEYIQNFIDIWKKESESLFEAIKMHSFKNHYWYSIPPWNRKYGLKCVNNWENVQRKLAAAELAIKTDSPYLFEKFYSAPFLNSSQMTDFSLIAAAKRKEFGLSFKRRRLVENQIIKIADAIQYQKIEFPNLIHQTHYWDVLKLDFHLQIQSNKNFPIFIGWTVPHFVSKPTIEFPL